MNADADCYFESLWKQMRLWNSKLSENSEKHLIIKKLQEQLCESSAVVLVKPLGVTKDLLTKSCLNKISELDDILENGNNIDPFKKEMLKTGSKCKEEEVKVETSDESDSSDNEKLSIVSKRLQTSNDVLQLPYALRKSSRKKSQSFKSVENLLVKSSKIIHKKDRTKRQFIYCCEEDAVCNRQTHHSLHIEIPRLFLQGQRHHLFLGNKLSEETFADLAREAKQRAFQTYPKESTNLNQRRRDTICSSIVTNQPTAEEAEIAQLVRNIIPGDGSDDEETWNAASVLESINNNVLDNYKSHIAKSPISFEPSSSKGHCSSAQLNKRGHTGKRGRKPKNKVSPLPQHKTTLAQYVENFGSDFDIAGTVTPAASSSNTLPVVSSIPQIFDQPDPGPVMCYIAGDWANGGTCQLVDANGLSLHGAQIQSDGMNDMYDVQDNALNENLGQTVVSLPLRSLDVSTLIQPLPVTQTTELQNTNFDQPVIDIQIPNIPVASTAITSSCKSNKIQQQPFPAHIKPPSTPIHSSCKSNEIQQQPLPAHIKTPSNPIRVLDLSIKSKATDDLHISTDMNNTNTNELADDNYATLPLDLSASATEPKLSNTNTIIANKLDAGLSQSQDSREDNGGDEYIDFVRCLDQLNFDRYTNKQYKGRDMPLLNLNSEPGDVFIGDVTKSLPVDSNYVSMNEENVNLQSHRSSNHAANDILNSLLDIGSFTAENGDNNNLDNNLSFLDLDYEKFDYTEISTSTFKVPDVNRDQIGDQNVTNDQIQDSKEANKDIHLSLYSNIEGIKLNPSNVVEKCDSMVLNKENCEQLQQCLDDITKNNNSPDKTYADFSSALAETTCRMPEINMNIIGTKNMDDGKKSHNTFEQQNDKNQDDKNDSQKFSKINLFSKSDRVVEKDATTSSHAFNIIQYIEETNLCNFSNNSKLVGSSEEPIVPHPNVPTPRIEELANNQQIVKNCESKFLNKTKSNEGDKKHKMLNKKTSENSRRQSLKNCISSKRQKQSKEIRTEKKTTSQTYKKDKTSTNEKIESQFNERDVFANTNGSENGVQLQNVTPPHPSPSSSKIVFSVKRVELSDETISLDGFEKARKRKARAVTSNIQENLNHIVMQLDDDALETLQKKPAMNYSYRESQHGYSPKEEETQAVFARLDFSKQPETKMQDLKLEKDDTNKCKSSAEVTAYLTTQDSDTGNGSSCQGSENISLEETMNLSSQESRQSIKDLAHLTNSIEGNIQNAKEKNESISQSLPVNTSQNSCKSIPKMSLWHIESKLDEDNLDFEADFDDTLSITASDICSPSDHFTESLDWSTNDVDGLRPVGSVTTESNADVFPPAFSITTNSNAVTKPARESSLGDLKNFKIPKLNKFLSAKFNNNKEDTTKISKSYNSIADINHFSLQPYVMLNRISINKDDKYIVTKELTDGHHIVKKEKKVNITLGNKKITRTIKKEDNYNNAIKTDDDNFSRKTQILKSEPKMTGNNATKTDGDNLRLKPKILKSDPKTPQIVKIDRDNLSLKPQILKSGPKMADKVKHHNNATETDGAKLSLKPQIFKVEPKTTQIVKCVINSNVSDKVKHQPPAPQCSNDGSINMKNIFGITCLPYLVDCCSKPHCQYSHELNDNETVFSSLKTSNKSHLMEAYSFMYNHEKLFKSFFLTFCNLYTMRLDRYKLLSMAIDCERYPQHSQFLDEVYEGLVKCGLSRANACNHILQTAKQRSPEFIDALVAIIIKSDWTVFADNIESFAVEYSFRFEALEKMSESVLHSNNQHLKMVFWKCVQMLHKDDVQLLTLHSDEVFEWVKILQNP